jgi:hypothetical protein
VIMFKRTTRLFPPVPGPPKLGCVRNAVAEVRKASGVISKTVLSDLRLQRSES